MAEPDAYWESISEADFLGWLTKALRRQGYLVAHVNAVASCGCCKRKKCPCGGRAVAKMEPGLPDLIAVNPRPECEYPLIVAELKSQSGRVNHKRGSTGPGRQRRQLPSQWDWILALRAASVAFAQRTRCFIIGEVWRPSDARRIQETILDDDGLEREPWTALDHLAAEAKSFGIRD